MIVIRRFAVLALLCGGVTARASDPPAAPVPTDPATGAKLDAAHTKPAGEWTGKVVKVSGSDAGSLTLRVEQVIQAPRPGTRLPVPQKVAQEMELSLAKDVIVRQMNLPPALNDVGKPRQRTAEETKKLKGTGNLPGYAAEFSQVRADDVVRVQAVQPKPPKGAKPTDSAPKPLVTMIVIVTEAPAPKKAP
jgi:hypothetical protein